MTQTMEPSESDPPELFDLAVVPPMPKYIKQVWDRRAYAVEVPLAEFRAQNLHTALGQLWHLLNPALQMGVYFLMFGVILDTDRGVDNFLMFLGAGLFCFRYSEAAAVKGARSLTANIGIIRSIRFPRALLPVSATVGQLLLVGPSIAVLCVLALATGELPRWQWFLLVPTLMLQTLFAFGLACWTARFSYQWSDLPNLLPFMFRLLFYMSGVLYSVEKFIDSSLVRGLFTANPFYAFIELWRYSFLNTPFRTEIWVSAVAWSVIASLSGLYIFKRSESTYGQG